MEAHVNKTTYGPLIDTALRALGFETFCAPNGTCFSARCLFTGPKKVSISRAQPPPTCPRNGFALHHKHYVWGHINHRSINSYNFIF